ncbi:MAG: hypothetical protein KDA63_05640 [Planctomycetales bacterium]|nr:hypothetical protein [Planctomycetales bacterium]
MGTTSPKNSSAGSLLSAGRSLWLVLGLVGVSCAVGIFAGAQREPEANYRIDLGDGRTVLVKCQRPNVETVDGKTRVHAGSHEWEASGPVQIEMLLSNE